MGLGKNAILNLYKQLLKKHGHQGWWPINEKYHPKDYTYPHDKNEAFEIAIGAILTQNTSWKNVDNVLKILREKGILSVKSILNIPTNELAVLIKSSGYYNQKALKLKKFAEFYSKNNLQIIKSEILREKLLDLWGIGKETADSILLYAYKKPYFVIDNYTKKLFSNKFKLDFNDYDSWQRFFQDNLSRNYRLFNEFHALIVAEGKLINHPSILQPLAQLPISTIITEQVIF